MLAAPLLTNLICIPCQPPHLHALSEPTPGSQTGLPPPSPLICCWLFRWLATTMLLVRRLSTLMQSMQGFTSAASVPSHTCSCLSRATHPLSIQKATLRRRQLLQLALEQQEPPQALSRGSSGAVAPCSKQGCLGLRRESVGCTSASQAALVWAAAIGPTGATAPRTHDGYLVEGACRSTFYSSASVNCRASGQCQGRRGEPGQSRDLTADCNRSLSCCRSNLHYHDCLSRLLAKKYRAGRSH